jgi:hypothetical protein
MGILPANPIGTANVAGNGARLPANTPVRPRPVSRKRNRTEFAGTRHRGAEGSHLFIGQRHLPACRRTQEPSPIREAGFASSRARPRPVRAPADPTDASEDRKVSSRGRVAAYDSRKTTARPARNSRLSGGRWRRNVSMHADLASYRSSRCARIGRICEDEATIRPEPGTRHNLFRSA